MTSRLERRVMGYPKVDLIGDYASLTQDQYVQITCNAGPGEFLGACVYSASGISTLYYEMNAKLTIDGVVVYDNVWRDWVLMPINYVGHGLFSTAELLTASIGSSSIGLVIPYNTSCVLEFKNRVAGTLTIVFGVFSRQGA